MEKAKKSVPKIKYTVFSNPDFSQTMQKLANVNTVPVKAAHIRRIVKKVEEARDVVVKAYETDIMEKFGKRDENGNLVRPDDNPRGCEFVDPQAKELLDAEKEFNEREIEIDWKPLTFQTISDTRLSARDIENLGDLLSEEEPQGPGLPHLPAFQ